MRFSPARINEMLFTREARLQNERRNSSLSRIGIGVEEDRGGAGRGLQGAKVSAAKRRRSRSTSGN